MLPLMGRQSLRPPRPSSGLGGGSPYPRPEWPRRLSPNRCRHWCYRPTAVRVAASPVNPSDLMFLEGRYAFKKELPAIPGIEGSGRVVATGSGLLARRLANRRVACATMPKGGGAWAQYAVASAGQCFALPDRIDDERGAMSLVNPLAALGLIERVDALRPRSFISTAAGSAVGQMLRRLARARHVDVINVVRSADQAERLRREGVDFVLVSSDADFELQLKELCAR